MTLTMIIITIMTMLISSLNKTRPVFPQDISPTVSTAAQTAIRKGTDDDDDDDDNNDDNNDNGDGMTSTTPTTRIPMMIRTLTIIASTS